jgi:hypothetical protein
MKNKLVEEAPYHPGYEDAGFEPAKFKDLSNEEIKKIWCEVYDFKDYDCLTELDYKFCREIIKKAQEK